MDRVSWSPWAINAAAFLLLQAATPPPHTRYVLNDRVGRRVGDI